MALSQTKLNRFVSANNNTGVVKHLQTGVLQLIARLPETELEVVYEMASESINTLQPVCTIFQKTDYFHKVGKLLALNGIASRRGEYANSIIVTSLPEVIIYDASQKS